MFWRKRIRRIRRRKRSIQGWIPVGSGVPQMWGKSEMVGWWAGGGVWGGRSPPTHISRRRKRRRRKRRRRKKRRKKRRRRKTFRVLCSWDGLVGERVGG